MLQRWTRPSPAVCWIALLLYVLCIFVWHDLCANWYLFSIFFLSLRLQSELIQYSQSAEGEILIY